MEGKDEVRAYRVRLGWYVGRDKLSLKRKERCWMRIKLVSCQGTEKSRREHSLVSAISTGSLSPDRWEHYLPVALIFLLHKHSTLVCHLPHGLFSRSLNALPLDPCMNGSFLSFRSQFKFLFLQLPS